jgi:hypothetical protein
MRHQRTPGTTPGDPANLSQALLGLVCEDHPSLWSLAELDRCLQSSDQARAGDQQPSHRVEDAVADLHAAGLIHRLGHFVFATRAALAAQALAS